MPFQPDDIDQQAFGQAVLAHNLLGQGLPTLGQREPAAIPVTYPSSRKRSSISETDGADRPSRSAMRA